MNTPSLLRAAVLCTIAVGLGGCASMSDTRTPTVEGYEQLRRGTMLPVSRTVTNFNDQLRCMDQQFSTYGASASLIVEDLNDKTQKVPAGTTDMFISAMSQMTRRSQSIRTVAFSDDTKNITGYMLKAGSKESFQPELIPTYAIRGSITQFDDNLAKKTADAGVTIGIGQKNFLGAGASKSSSINMVALDLAAVRARDFSIVPGVNARNSAAILQEGQGIDGEASYKKLGVNFMTSFSKSDGKTIAVRNLVELSAIELMGKLNKLPYWKCFNVPSSQPDVANEIEDWHYSMSGADKLQFYMRHFRTVGLLPEEGPVPGPMLKEALRSYFKALNLPYDGKFSLKLMQAHFEADQEKILPAAFAHLEEEKRNRLAVDVKLLPPNARDKSIASFAIVSNTDAYTYCFLQDEKKAVLRVLPNPWQPSAVLRARQPVPMPAAGFVVQSNPRFTQNLTCFATRNDIAAKLPSVLGGAGMAPINGAADMNAVAAALSQLGEEIVQASVEFGGTEVRALKSAQSIPMPQFAKG